MLRRKGRPAVDCLFDEWPGIGRGLDLARAHGAAELVGGEWRVMRDELTRQPVAF